MQLSESYCEFIYAHLPVPVPSESWHLDHLYVREAAGGSRRQRRWAYAGFISDIGLHPYSRQLALANPSLYWKTVSTYVAWCLIGWPNLCALLPFSSPRDTGWGPVRTKFPNSKLHS